MLGLGHIKRLGLIHQSQLEQQQLLAQKKLYVNGGVLTDGLVNLNRTDGSSNYMYINANSGKSGGIGFNENGVTKFFIQHRPDQPTGLKALRVVNGYQSNAIHMEFREDLSTTVYGDLTAVDIDADALLLNDLAGTGYT